MSHDQGTWSPEAPFTPSSARRALAGQLEEMTDAVIRNHPRPAQEPDLAGDEARVEFLRAFDTALARACTDRPAVALSSGLDSGLVMARLLRNPKTEVDVWVIRPHPDTPGIRPGVDDEWERIARWLTPHRGRVTMRQIVNTERVWATDAARELAEFARVPSITPGTLWCWRAMAQRVRDSGAPVLLTGVGGNEVFSGSHAYASRFYAARGDARNLIGLIRDGVRNDDSLGQALRRVVGPLRNRRPPDQVPSLVSPFVRGGAVRRWSVAFTRDDFLARLAIDPIESNPIYARLAPEIQIRSPYLAPEVVAVARRITPRTWVDGPINRRFARSLLAGQVPDEIRLHRGVGVQGADAWFIHHDGRDRYLAEVDDIAGTPILQDLVDLSALRSEVRRWSWGDPSSPPPNFQPVTRILMLAVYLRVRDKALRREPGHVSTPAPNAWIA